MRPVFAALCLSVCAVISMAAPGGFFALQDSEVQPVVDFAVEKLGPEYSLVEVLDKQAQLVSGILYRLTLKVEKTQPNEEARLETCFVEVHVQAWRKFKEVTASHCRAFNSQTDRQLPAPVSDVRLSNPAPGGPANPTDHNLGRGQPGLRRFHGFAHGRAGNTGMLRNRFGTGK